MSSRFFDLLNFIIYDLKRSVDLRLLFDPVLHSSLDDLVLCTLILLPSTTISFKIFTPLSSGAPLSGGLPNVMVGHSLRYAIDI